MSGSTTGLVGFTYTPPNNRVPLTTFEVSSAGTASQGNQRALLIGSATLAQPLVAVQLFGATYAAGLFGPDSMLSRMATKYALNDGFGEVWALPVPLTASTEAVYQIAFVGTATAASTFAIYVGDQAVQVAVQAGQTGAAVAATAAAAINALASLPLGTVTAPTTSGAGNANGTLSLPCLAMGVAGNALAVGINLLGVANGEILPPGLTVSVSQSTVGAGTPTVPDLRPILGDTTFDLILTGFTDSGTLAALSQLLADSAGRWSPTAKIWGHALGAISAAQPQGLVSVTGAMNDQHRTIFGTVGVPTPPWEVAAAIGGAVFPSLKADPGRPLQTLPVLGVMAPPVSQRLTGANKQALLVAGCACLAFDAGGNASVLRAVTTYETNAYGVSDLGYLDTETLFEIMAFLRRLDAAFALKFGRVKLADNGTHYGAGVAIVTPNDIRNEIIAEYSTMEQEGLVEDTAGFAQGLVVERNASDPSRCDALVDPVFVSGLRVLSTLCKFSLLPPAQAAA